MRYHSLSLLLCFSVLELWGGCLLLHRRSVDGVTTSTSARDETKNGIAWVIILVIYQYLVLQMVCYTRYLTLANGVHTRGSSSGFCFNLKP